MDEKFMKLALKQAQLAYKHDEVPIGAVLVKNGEVVAKAYNKKNTTRNSLKHAEIIALEKYQKKTNDWHFYDLTLYTTLEPCPMCAGALINFRVGRVVFGASDKKAGACGTVLNLLTQKEFNHHPKVVGGILEEECGQILTKFFKQKR